ncbi:MAG: MnhB domain-containing protein [Planctomycetota bacterium]|nr:MnhB domain-containing protein [Planctomycetota bacterium]
MRTEKSPVIRYVALRAVPFIQLYALYVLGHGEDGPGGGFQGGVIFASSFVLMALVYGYGTGRKGAPEKITDILAPAGCVLYAGIGLICLLMGGAFLEYGRLAGEGASEAAKHSAHHFGLIGIEAGVMITVTASMITLFFEMARDAHVDHGQDDDDGEDDDA